jgi:DnaK suppressor protein
MIANKKAIRQKLIWARNEIASEEDVFSAGDADDLAPVAVAHVPRDSGVSEVIDVRTRQIAQALICLDQDTYGDCADCGQPIPPRRLEAIPFATLCVTCQSAADRRQRK